MGERSKDSAEAEAKAQTERALGKMFSDLGSRAIEKLGNRVPARVSVSELSKATTHVLGAAAQDNKPEIITYRGVPSFALLPLDDTDREILAAGLIEASAGLRHDAQEAERALEAGDVTVMPSPSAE